MPRRIIHDIYASNTESFKSAVFRNHSYNTEIIVEPFYRESFKASRQHSPGMTEVCEIRVGFTKPGASSKV